MKCKINTGHGQPEPLNIPEEIKFTIHTHTHTYMHIHIDIYKKCANNNFGRKGCIFNTNFEVDAFSIIFHVNNTQVLCLAYYYL